MNHIEILEGRNNNLGISDIMRIHPVYRLCVDLEKKHNWGFQFKEDSGGMENAIEFFETLYEKEIRVIPYHPPLAKNWNDAENIRVPDILDFHNRIIIEIEEESKPNKGPKIRKKGHWEESRRDQKRDWYYIKAKFRIFKVWESQMKDMDQVKNDLWKFLSDCFTKRI